MRKSFVIKYGWMDVLVAIAVFAVTFLFSAYCFITRRNKEDMMST